MFKKTLIAALMTTSFGIFAATPVELNIASGGEGGFYETTMRNIAAQINKKYKGKTPLTLNVENTEGTLANIEGLNDGEFDIVIAQADGLSTTKSLPPGAVTYNAHKEAVYFLINKDFHENEGVDDLEDIEGNIEYRLAVVEGSGALVTLRSFVAEDAGYAPNLDNAVYFDDMYDAAEAVANGITSDSGKKVKMAGMLYVSRIGYLSGQIIEDFGTQLVIGEATDGDFNDAEDVNGDSLYVNCSITSNDRQGMKAATFGDQDTICLNAQVVFNPAWLDNFESRKDKKKAKKAVKRGINGELKKVR